MFVLPCVCVCCKMVVFNEGSVEVVLSSASVVMRNS